MKKSDFFWLVGLLEGEGSFLKGPPSQPTTPQIAVMSTDQDVIERIANLFGTSCYKVVRRKDHWKEAFRTSLRGKPAVDLMLKLKPYMSIRRQQQITRAAACYVDRKTRKLTDDQVTEIRRLVNEEKKNKLQVAEQFGVSQRLIYGIVNLEIYVG